MRCNSTGEPELTQNEPKTNVVLRFLLHFLKKPPVTLTVSFNNTGKIFGKKTHQKSRRTVVFALAKTRKPMLVRSRKNTFCSSALSDVCVIPQKTKNNIGFRFLQDGQRHCSLSTLQHHIRLY